jgi:hypothetical protein
MFELFLPYLIAGIIGIAPEGDSPTVMADVTEVTDVAATADRLPEDQTPTGKFTTAGEVKPILGMTKANWVAVRNYENQDLLYFTHLMSWRCGIWEVRYGLNGAAPIEIFEMEPCYEDTASPNSMMVTEGYLPFMTFAENSIESIIVEITFDDGTVETGEFARSSIEIP